MIEPNNFSEPRIPLPAPLMMSEANPFAYFTLTKRMPAIVQRVISENDFCSEIVQKLETLRQELPNKTVSLLTDEGQDVANWDRYLQPFIGKRWIDMPWFFAEAYFYRRILEATHYFLAGKSFGVDPYGIQKRRGLETAINSIRELSARVNDRNHTSLVALLYFALWGNRADMSLFPINSEDNNQQEIHLKQSHILVDNTPQVAKKSATSKM